MKNYLNQNELFSLVYMTQLATEVEKVKEEWAGRNNLTEGEQGSAIAAVAALKDLLTQIVRRLKPDQSVRYVRACNENIAMLRPKMTEWEYKLWAQREEEENKRTGVWVETETAAALADLLLFKCCNPCCQDACDRANCAIRPVLTLMDIPAYDEYAEGCPYDNGGAE